MAETEAAEGAGARRRKGRRKGRVREWRVHLGAHKTATTHLQQALADRRQALREAGVDFLPMRKVRAAGLPNVLKALKAEDADRQAKRRALAGMLRPLRRGGVRVALSEENLIGIPAHLLEPRLYPKAGRMVRFLSLLGSGAAELHLFFAIRSWDTMLPSAYAEANRRRAIPGGFEAVRARALEAPPRWSDLLARIASSAPKATLRVWRYEDYASHGREAATLFLGVDPGELDVAQRPQGTATPSAAAVAETEALPDALSMEARAEAANEIYRRLPAASGGKFNPFTEAERGLLREAYEEDLARIDRKMPGVLVRWD